MVALLTKTGSSSNTQQIQVQIEMRMTDSGQISGYVQGAPVSGNAGGSSNTQTAPNTSGGDQEDSGVRNF